MQILQLLAAVRLDPDNVQFEDSDVEASGDDINSCPPTSSNKVTRERVLSDEGKQLFLDAHDPRAASMSRQSTTDGRYPTSEYGDDESDAHSQDNGYVPPMAAWQQPRDGFPANARYTQSQSSISDGASTRDGEDGPSGFSFLSNAAPEHDDAVKGSSAFGFISSTDGDDDASSQTSLTDRPSGNSATSFDFMHNKGASQRSSPRPPTVQAEDFLNTNPSLDQNEFADLWDSTNESCVGCVAVRSASRRRRSFGGWVS